MKGSASCLICRNTISDFFEKKFFCAARNLSASKKPPRGRCFLFFEFAFDLIKRAEQLVGFKFGGTEDKIPGASVGDKFAAERFFEFCEAVPWMAWIF